MTCKECRHYTPDKEKYIGRCAVTDRPVMSGDTCGCGEEKESRKQCVGDGVPTSREATQEI